MAMKFVWVVGKKCIFMWFNSIGDATEQRSERWLISSIKQPYDAAQDLETVRHAAKG